MTKNDLEDFDLNHRQKLFCLYFCLDPDTKNNATESYLKAFTNKSGEIRRASATDAANKLLKKDEIKRCLKYILQKAQTESDTFNSYETLDTINICSNFNIAYYCDERGLLKKPLAEYGAMAKAIESVEPVYDQDGKFLGLKPRFCKREKFIDMMMKYLELIRPEDIQTNDSSIIYVNPMNSETGYEQMVVDFKSSQRQAK